METVIQQIIDKYYRSNIYRCEFTEWLIENKDILIKKEKEQIEDAFEFGFFDSMSDTEKFGSGRQYVIKTYNSNI